MAIYKYKHWGKSSAETRIYQHLIESFPMDLQSITDEALHLPREKRAQLIQRLILKQSSPSKEDLTPDWLQEARRRADELDNGSVQAVPGDDVMMKARAQIK
jgi:putative addiction module component (TIGR02574 family)